jgi:RNA polymerase sigma factor (sigma-70 family)
MEAVLVQRLEGVYRKQRQALLGFIRSRTRTDEEAEDVLQDVFFQALRNASATEPIDNIVAWLYTIARNKIIDLYRRKHRTVSLHGEKDDSSLEELLHDSGIDIEKELFRTAVMDTLVEALEELPRGQREAFIEQAMEGRTFREISERTGTPLNTLIARKRYAVQFLRRRLHELKEMLDELA